jgi:hypothetical protein
MQAMEHTLPFILQWDENFDVDADTRAPVDDQDYQVPFAFNGKLDKLTLSINRSKLTPADIKALEQAGSAGPRSTWFAKRDQTTIDGKQLPAPDPAFCVVMRVRVSVSIGDERWERTLPPRSVSRKSIR